MSLDLSEYMGAYVDGSRENLDTMDKMLLNLEQNPANLDAVEEIFRAAHTLKGMSATMGFEKIAHLTHEMENILDKLRNEDIPVTTEVVDVIFETFDVLRTLVNDSIASTDSNVDLSDISAKLVALSTGQSTVSEAPSTGAPSPSAATSETPAEGGLMSDLASLAITDFEVAGLSEAVEMGSQLFLVKVSLVSDCLLKGARVFMVSRALDDTQCEIIRSIPEVKDLENEKFDTAFMMLVTTNHDGNEIVEAIESISEIETVEVIPVELERLSGEAPVDDAPAPLPDVPPVTNCPQTSATSASAETPSPSPSPAQTPAPAPVEAATQQVSNEQMQSIIHAAQAAVSSGEGASNSSQESDRSEDEDQNTKETINQVLLLTCNMAGEVYGLEIKQVEAIINLVKITRVPKAPPYINGVINLRGEIVPVIDTRLRLKLPVIDNTATTQIVILSFDEEKIKVGFLVDSVNEVIAIPETAIEPPTRVSESVEIEYLKGVGKVDGKIIILLNTRRIIFGSKRGDE